MEVFIMEGLITVGKKAGGKLLEVGLEKLLGIKIEGITLEAYGKQAVLAIFAMQSMHPEPDFETQTKIRFTDLENKIADLRQDLNELKDEMTDFKWQVQTLLYEHREEDLWQTMFRSRTPRTVTTR